MSKKKETSQPTEGAKRKPAKSVTPPNVDDDANWDPDIDDDMDDDDDGEELNGGFKSLAKVVSQLNKETGLIKTAEMTVAEFLEEYIYDVGLMIDHFNNALKITSNLTGKERQRLTSARVRNNGFIDKAFDVARDNPAYLPPHFDKASLDEKMHLFELLRQLLALINQLQHSAQDAFILQANECFADAIRIYRSLQEQKRSGVAGAASLFELLSIYFKNRRRVPAEPTEKQLEKDVKRLIKGKAEGEIVIKNETPYLTGGLHEVVDNVHTGRTAVKGTVEESTKE